MRSASSNLGIPLLLVSLLAGCSEVSTDVADPTSRACLDCLSERESGGCADQYAACEQVSACDEYVICQLTGRCFERPSGSGCEQELECKRPSAASAGADGDAGSETPSPRELAADFEDCARSACAATCGFAK